MPDRTYTQSEVVQILTNLVNGIGHFAIGEIMPKRYKEQVNINGQKRWITGATVSDLLEAYLNICLDAGIVRTGIGEPQQTTPVLFGQYLQDFVATYKNNQESLTMKSRQQLITKHILPRWENTPVQSIKTMALQKWFNDLETQGYSHETLVKLKNTMSPAFDAAVEENIIQRNPLKSSLLVIGGTETKGHTALPPEKMQEIRDGLPNIADTKVRCMGALLCYTGMRMEEILGLRWEDIDFENDWITIQRAVVHPDRNQPEIKDPKTKTSKRRIPLSQKIKALLVPRQLTGFILHPVASTDREKPLSFTEARRVFDKLRKTFDIPKYTAHDFRDTCATEWREKGIPLDIISSLLGHSKTDITQKRYVKYRDELFQDVRALLDSQKGTDSEQIG